MLLSELELLSSLYKSLTAVDKQVIWVLSDRDQKLLSDSGARMPQHIHCTTFVDQNDILGHNGITLFVTQAGSNSFYEVRTLLKMCNESESMQHPHACSSCP